MNKITLVLRPNEFTSFTSWYLDKFWCRYFDIEMFDESRTYNKNTTIFIVIWTNVADPQVIQLKQQGYKVAIDHLWERPKNQKDFYWIECNNWFWYNESLWWEALGQHARQPNSNPTKLAFMPIRKENGPRIQLKKAMDEYLDQFIWSFLGKTLPGDIDSSSNEYQRYINSQWYDDTYFSIVAETFVDGATWITEKSFKPIAHYHPYMIAGQPLVLQYLQNLGFETFDNMFDESYDKQEQYTTRLQIIKCNVANFTRQPYSTLTQQKLKHNHNHFFDQQLVKDRIVQEVINPLIEYAETR